MMAISQTSIYAVRALSCMDCRMRQFWQIHDVAECAGIPKPYLAKILHQLQFANLVHAKRGYRGGIALNRPPAEISLLEVVEAIEGKNWIPECLFGFSADVCRKVCPTHNEWTKVRAQIRKVFATTTLADTAVYGEYSRRQNAEKCQGHLKNPGALGQVEENAVAESSASRQSVHRPANRLGRSVRRNATY